MNKFKIKLTGFDIGMIIAFVVVALLGGGGWWVLSGRLQDAQTNNQKAESDVTTYSVKSGIVVNARNRDTLQANSDLLKTQVDPLISNYLLAKDDPLASVKGEDPVAWKHDLDEDVRTLVTEAKAKSVTLPGNSFYFGFRRYLTQSPGDEATLVLTKQRMGIKAIAEILINANISGISKIRRSYEEDEHAANVLPSGNERTEDDQVAGYAVTVPGGFYTAYPFEIEFDSVAEPLRPVIDGLVKSPYLFVVRRVEIHNDKTTSPGPGDLDKMAAVQTGASSVVGSAPGEVAASAPAIGPQYLFGNSVLHVKMRVDMIEWNPDLKDVDAVPSNVPPKPKTH